MATNFEPMAWNLDTMVNENIDFLSSTKALNADAAPTVVLTTDCTAVNFSFISSYRGRGSIHYMY